MPKGWSSKDERKYEHIKQGEQERGAPPKRAKEIAARTVNKERRLERRTPNRRTQGTGNPTRRLDERTVEELRNRAAELAVKGRSRMNKKELVTAVRNAE